MDSNKRHKKTKECKCSFCNEIFFTYSYSNQNFCSKECFYNSIRELRPKHICCVCGKLIQTSRHRHIRNTEYYCSRECYNFRRSNNLLKIKRHTKYFLNFVSNGCIDCGEKRYYLLQIHHIDSNPNNNNDHNLEVLCGNCHIKRHLRLNKKGIYVYSPKSLTDRTILKNL